MRLYALAAGEHRFVFCGSGFVVEDGCILTCAHVVTSAQTIMDAESGMNLPAMSVALDPTNRRLHTTLGGQLVVCPCSKRDGAWIADGRAALIGHVKAASSDWLGSSVNVRGCTIAPSNEDVALVCVGLPLQLVAALAPGHEELLQLGPPFTLCARELMPTEALFILGFPEEATGTLIHTRGSYVGRMQDEHGDWLLFHGLVLPGHSGGPCVTLQGGVVGWNVRNRLSSDQAGLNHARPVNSALDFMANHGRVHPAEPSELFLTRERVRSPECGAL